MKLLFLAFLLDLIAELKFFFVEYRIIKLILENHWLKKNLILSSMVVKPRISFELLRYSLRKDFMSDLKPQMY